jgi:hypothetical protein
MSFEKKCLLEIGDISALPLQCAKCGSESVLPLAVLRSADWVALVTSPCPHCHTPSGVRPDTAEGRAFLGFIDELAKVAEAADGRNLRLRLETQCPA